MVLYYWVMSDKPVIAIISVLKPVNDSRNYEKIAYTLAKENKYKVYVIGQPVINYSEIHENIGLHELPKLKRLSLKRLLVQFQILQFLIKVKPKAIIANTHELLEVTVLYKILFGALIIYDIQENYYRNIIYGHAFSGFIKWPVALVIRFREVIFSLIFDHFILAEKCYETELSFISSIKQTLLDNKVLIPYEIKPNKIKGSKSTLKFIYSGTVAKEYGVFDAIQFVEQMNDFAEAELLIIGYCANMKTTKLLREKISDKPYIKTIGIDSLVPHNQILNELVDYDFSLLPYPDKLPYNTRIPTKIYECLFLQIPMILRPLDAWQELFNEYDGFLTWDFDQADKEFMSRIRNASFYTKQNINKSRLEFESGKLVNLFSSFNLD